MIRKPLLPLGVHRTLPADRDVASYRVAVVGRRREVLIKLALAAGGTERVFLPGTLAGKLADLLSVAIERRRWPEEEPAVPAAPHGPSAIGTLLRRRPPFTARDRSRDEDEAAFEPADLELHAREEGFVVGFGDVRGAMRAYRFARAIAHPLRRTLRHALDRGGAVDLRVAVPGSARLQ